MYHLQDPSNSSAHVSVFVKQCFYFVLNNLRFGFLPFFFAASLLLYLLVNVSDVFYRNRYGGHLKNNNA